MHYETEKLYEGPPCESCRRTFFIGTCTHRPMKRPEWKPILGVEKIFTPELIERILREGRDLEGEWAHGLC